MDAGGLQPLRPVRRVCIRVDSRRALLRRKTLAAANCLGADLVSHGPFTCSKYRDLRFADAACGALAPVVAIRAARGSVCQDDLPVRFSRDAGRNSWALNMGLRGQSQVYAHGNPVTG